MLPLLLDRLTALMVCVGVYILCFVCLLHLKLSRKISEHNKKNTKYQYLDSTKHETHSKPDALGISRHSWSVACLEFVPLALFGGDESRPVIDTTMANFCGPKTSAQTYHSTEIKTRPLALVNHIVPEATVKSHLSRLIKGRVIFCRIEFMNFLGL